MKKITFLLAALCMSISTLNAQEVQEYLTASNEIALNQNVWNDSKSDDEKVKTFREQSLGILFMPIPLNIDKIKITQNGTEETLEGSDDLFNTGLGVVLNSDFNKSGFGFGTIVYFAIISGDSGLRSYDVFGALKYDIPLGSRLTTNFEISPLVGIGHLSLEEKDSELKVGGSMYFSAGARLTWRIANNLYLGGDFQTTPIIFNTEKLLGIEDEVDEAKIEYKFFAQLNLSLRYSIF